MKGFMLAVFCTLLHARAILSKRHDTINGTSLKIYNEFDKKIARVTDKTLDAILLSAPDTIRLLGELMLMSDTNLADFSLVDKTPPNGFKHVRQPTSIAACLQQISHDGRNAFLKAHKNMDKIRAYMNIVPETVSSVVGDIANAPDSVVQDMVESGLDVLMKLSTNSENLAVDAGLGFQNVISLIEEIVEATKAKRTDYNKELQQIEQNIIMYNKERKFFNEKERILNETKRQIEQEIAEYKVKFDEAIKNIPTTRQIAGMRFFDNLESMLTEIPKVIEKSSKRGLVAGRIAVKNLKTDDQKYLFGANVIIQPLMTMLVNNLEVFNELDKTFLRKGDTSFSVCELFVKTLTMSLKELNKASPDELVNKAKTLIRDSMEFCESFETANENNESSDATDFKTKLIALTHRAESLIFSTGRNVDSGGDEKGSTTSAGSQNNNHKYGETEQSIAEIFKDRLHEAEAKAEDMIKNILQVNEDIFNVTQRISSLHGQNKSIYEIVQLMIESFKCFTQLAENWRQFVLFFHHVSHTIKEQNLKSLKFKVDAEKFKLGDKDAAILISDRLHNVVGGIIDDATYTFNLSITFVDVSEKHFLTPLSELSKLKVVTKQEVTMFQGALKTQMQNAKNDIRALLLSKQNQYVCSLKSQLSTGIASYSNWEVAASAIK